VICRGVPQRDQVSISLSVRARRCYVLAHACCFSCVPWFRRLCACVVYCRVVWFLLCLYFVFVFGVC